MEPHNLTKDEALSRSSIISTGIGYNVFLSLPSGSDTFFGQVTMHLKVLSVEDTFIEFVGKKVNSLIVNGKQVEHINWSDGLIHVKSSLLQQGQNTISVKFEGLYQSEPLGLHKYTDEDGKEFIYSKGEPYANHMIFPMFDQPNLKATMTLRVSIPSHWVCASNQPTVPAASSTLLPDELWSQSTHKGQPSRVVSFLRTPLLSTYLFAVVAGDYYRVESPGGLLHKGIPQSLLCKPNLAEFANQQAPHIFELTAKCMAEFENLFGCPYPFLKCDTAFCPEYSMGAMENPGIVTFDEKDLFAGQPSISQETDRGVTIAHEQAHMWFGNLVTMEWWDDLWLNESFAEFVCYLCLHLVTPKLSYPLNNAWQKMLLSKAWGYEADESENTTHAVYEPVPILPYLMISTVSVTTFNKK
jgi:aminopeptidase N